MERRAFDKQISELKAELHNAIDKKLEGVVSIEEVLGKGFDLRGVVESRLPLFLFPDGRPPAVESCEAKRAILGFDNRHSLYETRKGFKCAGCRNFFDWSELQASYMLNHYHGFLKKNTRYDWPFPDDAVALGLQWKLVEGTTPSGPELTNVELSKALQERANKRKNKNAATFTQTEWDNFGVTGLTYGHFIPVGDAYFQPDWLERE